MIEQTILIGAMGALVSILIFVTKLYLDLKKELKIRIRSLEHDNIRNLKDIEYLKDERFNPFKKMEEGK